MKCIRYSKNKQTPDLNGVVATIGNFDGLHRGHQALIAMLKQRAHAQGLKTLVILFEPQPREYFQKNNAPKRLMRLREKINALFRLGIDEVCCLKFNAALAKLSPNDFVNQILLANFKVKTLIVGDDFRFGHQRAGDLSLLKQLLAKQGGQLETFAAYNLNGVRVSSTQIRLLLEAGHLEEANELLGQPIMLSGRVIQGAQLGRTFGVPTANINLKGTIPPISGVFCVQAQGPHRTYQGVANVGLKPTVSGAKMTLEVHLLDCNENLYGQLFFVQFLHKIRKECKFTNIEELVTQIHKDIAFAQSYFSHANVNHEN